MPEVEHDELHVNKTSPKKLYLFHHKLIPSRLAKGYEVWEIE